MVITHNKKSANSSNKTSSSIGIPSIFFKNKSILNFNQLTSVPKSSNSQRSGSIWDNLKPSIYGEKLSNRVRKSIIPDQGYLDEQKIQACRIIESKKRKFIESQEVESQRIKKFCVNDAQPERSLNIATKKILSQSTSVLSKHSPKKALNTPNYIFNRTIDKEYTIRDESFLLNPSLFEQIQNVQVSNKVSPIKKAQFINILPNREIPLEKQESLAPPTNANEKVINLNVQSSENFPVAQYKTKSIRQLLLEIDNHRRMANKTKKLPSKNINERLENIKNLLSDGNKGFSNEKEAVTWNLQSNNNSNLLDGKIASILPTPQNPVNEKTDSVEDKSTKLESTDSVKNIQPTFSFNSNPTSIPFGNQQKLENNVGSIDVLPKPKTSEIPFTLQSGDGNLFKPNVSAAPAISSSGFSFGSNVAAQAKPVVSDTADEPSKVNNGNDNKPASLFSTDKLEKTSISGLSSNNETSNQNQAGIASASISFGAKPSTINQNSSGLSFDSKKSSDTSNNTLFGQTASSSSSSIFSPSIGVAASTFGQAVSSSNTTFGSMSNNTLGSTVTNATSQPFGISFGQSSTASSITIGQSVSTSSNTLGQPISTPGLSFGMTSANTLGGQSASISSNIVGAPSNNLGQSVSTPSNLFGQSMNTPSTSSFALTQSTNVPTNTFGQSSNAPVSTLGKSSNVSSFAFGQSTSALTNTFGQSSNAPANSNTSSFAFGQPTSAPTNTFGQSSNAPASTTNSNTNSFAFGQSTSAPSNTFGQSTGAPTNAFGQSTGTLTNTFGQSSNVPASTTNSNTPSFAFGQSTATPTNTFGQSTGAPTNTFGQSSNAPANSNTSSFAFGQSTSAPSNTFGQSTGAPTNTFGQPSNAPASTLSNSSNTPSFAFGQSTGTPTNTFGQSSNAPASTFGNSANTSSFAFGQSTATPTNTFGQSTGAPTNTFGQSSNAPANSNTSSFAFGQSTGTTNNSFGQSTGTTNNSFGQSASTPTNTFGQSLNAPASTLAKPSNAPGFAFGQSSNTPTNTFGQSSSISGSAFGQSSTTSNNASGSIFGQSSNAQSGSLFDQNSNKPGSTFGQSSITSGNTFGQPTTALNNTLGQSSNTSGFAFGQSTNTQNSAFAQSTNATGTTMSQSSNPTGFAFGQSGTPSVNIFGQSTGTPSNLFDQTVTAPGNANGQQSNLFGQSNNNLNGVSGQSIATPSNNLFGVDQSKAKPNTGFMQQPTAPSLQSSTGLFGQNATASVGPFGQSSMLSNKPVEKTTVSSLFGNSSSLTTKSFGQPSTDSGIFGQRPNEAPNTLFGQSNNGNQVFGQANNSSFSIDKKQTENNFTPSQTISNSTGFMFNQADQNKPSPFSFGKTDTIVTNAKSMFGNNNLQTPTGQLNFGNSSFGQNDNKTDNLFGQASNTNSSFSNSRPNVSNGLGFEFGKEVKPFTVGQNTTDGMNNQGNMGNNPVFGQNIFGQSADTNKMPSVLGSNNQNSTTSANAFNFNSAANMTFSNQPTFQATETPNFGQPNNFAKKNRRRKF